MWIWKEPLGTCGIPEEAHGFGTGHDWGQADGQRLGGEKPGVLGQGQAGSQGDSEFLPHPAGLTPSRVPSSPAGSLTTLYSRLNSAPSKKKKKKKNHVISKFVDLGIVTLLGKRDFVA